MNSLKESGKLLFIFGQKSLLFLEGFLLPGILPPYSGAQRAGTQGPTFSNKRNGPDSDR